MMRPITHDDDDRAALERARSLAIACTRGVLETDAGAFRVRHVVDPETARILISCDDPDLRDATEHVLCVPDDSFDALRILLDCNDFDGRPERLSDRHLAFHDARREPVWLLAEAVSGKTGEGVWSGDELLAPDPIAGAETSILHRLNRDRSALADLVHALSGTRPLDPTAVSACSIGAHVRATVGVIFFEWPRELTDPSSAPAEVERLLDEHGSES